MGFAETPGRPAVHVTRCGHGHTPAQRVGIQVGRQKSCGLGKPDGTAPDNFQARTGTELMSTAGGGERRSWQV
jgi:hypothetical protein